MASRTYKEFLRNIRKLGDENAYLRSWNRDTVRVMDEAGSRAPIASGDLVGSRDRRRAKIKRGKGIMSAVIFKVPYAQFIETGKKRDGTPIRLKNPGERSGTVAGVTITKAKKGETQYLSKAVRNNADLMVKHIAQLMGKQFRRI